eukprot:jgi/Galph1/4420/GphlegSOOS_G3123.1
MELPTEQSFDLNQKESEDISMLKERVLTLPPDQLSAHEKNLRRIFRNRASAERSRRRRIKLIEELERENLSLRQHLESLHSIKLENQRLKEELVELEKKAAYYEQLKKYREQ